MRKLGVLLLAVAVLFSLSLGLAGCGEEKQAEVKKDEAKKPPEPTPEEIASKIRQEVLGPIAAEAAKGEISPEARQKLAGALGQARTTNQNTENGLKALDIIANELDQFVQQSKTAKRWTAVLAGAEAYAVLQPGSTKMERVKEQATREANKPKVRVRGFMTDHAGKRTMVMLTLTIPATGARKDVQVAEGDEFDGLRFNKIIGDQRGIELEVVGSPGETFEVMKNE